MKLYRLVCDRMNTGAETVIYNRHLVKVDDDCRTDHEKYVEQNIAQFYDFVNPHSEE